jgi:microcin C transport system substrate-binding protein
MRRLAGTTVRVAATLALLLCAPLVRAQMPDPEPGVTVTHALSEFGEPSYPAGFPHWRYASPDAPKGGTIALGAFGSFDTLNTLVERATWPLGIGLLYDSLMTGNGDELATVYANLAEWARFPDDKSWIEFGIRAGARFHDGTPVTAHDVKFYFDTVKAQGRVFLKSFYEDLESAEVTAERRIRFNVRTRNQMKPLVTAGGLIALPRHWWATRDPARATLEPPLGSGPYRVKTVDAGRSITYERVKDWWARDLNVARGLHNFDEIRYDYFRDDTVLFEAFLAGRLDFRGENRAQRWVQGYDTPDVRAGRIVRAEVPSQSPRGAYGLMMNTRRGQFADIRARQALEILYDFESVQRTLLFGQYQRLKSWFPLPPEYSASGLPTPAETAILEPFRDRLRPEVLTQPFEPPKTDGTGQLRTQTREALRLFGEAGWTVRNNQLVNARGERFRTEILLRDQSVVRIVEPYVQALQRIGIDASVRVVDTAQYQNRTDDYDFDMVVVAFNFFAPPSTEMRSYFTAESAEKPYGGNYAGIRDPIVDALVERIVKRESLEDLQAATRALDRVLLWGRYVIHFWYQDKAWIAHWNRFGRPDTASRFGVGDFPTTWWIDPAKQAALGR